MRDYLIETVLTSGAHTSGSLDNSFDELLSVLDELVEGEKKEALGVALQNFFNEMDEEFNDKYEEGKSDGYDEGHSEGYSEGEHENDRSDEINELEQRVSELEEENSDLANQLEELEGGE